MESYFITTLSYSNLYQARKYQMLQFFKRPLEAGFTTQQFSTDSYVTKTNKLYLKKRPWCLLIYFPSMTIVGVGEVFENIIKKMLLQFKFVQL